MSYKYTLNLHFFCVRQPTKVRPFLDHSCCSILSSFKIVVIFNLTSAEIKTKSADIVLKMTIILKELRIAQLCPKNGWTLYNVLLHSAKLAGVENILCLLKNSH